MKEESVIKERIFKNVSLVTQALASPTRLLIIQHLSNRPHSVEELSSVVNESIGNTSQHLQRMFKSGLVSFKKNGVSRVYQLSNPKVLEIWTAIQASASLLNPVIKVDENKLCPPELCCDTSLNDITLQIRNNKAILIDARSSEDTSFTPVKGALNIDHIKLKKEFSKLSKSKIIYVFCRGPYCPRANNIVEILRAEGYKAFRLKENFHQINLIKDSLSVH